MMMGVCAVATPTLSAVAANTATWSRVRRAMLFMVWVLGLEKMMGRSVRERGFVGYCGFPH